MTRSYSSSSPCYSARSSRSSLRRSIDRWLCRHGHHRWEYAALTNADLCLSCGEVWYVERSWEFATVSEVFGHHDMQVVR